MKNVENDAKQKSEQISNLETALSTGKIENAALQFQLADSKQKETTLAGVLEAAQENTYREAF